MTQMTADCAETFKLTDDQIHDLDPDDQAAIEKFSSGGVVPKYVTVEPEKWLLLDTYRRGLFGKSFENYKDFQIRQDDVFIMGLPRSGTRMIEELVWILVNNLDYDKAEKFESSHRTPHLEADLLFVIRRNAHKGVHIHFMSGLEQLRIMKTRRTILTHLPFCLLPSDIMKSKIVYIARNPKDLAVSLFNLQKNIKIIGSIPRFEDFWYCFKNNLVFYGPYWAHIKQAWDERERSNVHFVFYEDFVADLRNGVEKLAKFLEKNIGEPDIEHLVELVKFDNFKKRHLENLARYAAVKREAYLRYGRPGAWREYFGEEMEKEAKEWVEENVKRIGIQNFPSP